MPHTQSPPSRTLPEDIHTEAISEWLDTATPSEITSMIDDHTRWLANHGGSGAMASTPWPTNNARWAITQGALELARRVTARDRVLGDIKTRIEGIV